MVSDTAEHALTLIDRYAFELLVLAYEFDHFFPGLLEHPELRQALEVTLPARVLAAQEGLADGTAGAPLDEFIDEQLAGTRTILEGAIDISEVTEAFILADDALYLWLRRYDCIDAERVRVAVLACRNRELLVGRANGRWGLPAAFQQPGENLELTALRALEEEVGLILPEECLREMVAKNYDYDGGLCWTMFLLADCAPDITYAPRARLTETQFVSWGKLTEDSFAPALSDELAETPLPPASISKLKRRQCKALLPLQFG